MLYDAGPSYYASGDAGERVVLPFLRYQGVKHLDMIMLSHGDLDHAGGLRSVLQGISVSQRYSGQPSRMQYFHAQQCLTGQGWSWDGVRFDVLHPDQEDQFKGNNLSCVLLIDNGTHRVLLTGDIEAKVERWLVKKYPEDLRADVLFAPHHGSAGASTEQFVRAVKPNRVLYSAGYLNRYGMPRQIVVDRYRRFSAQQMITHESGAVLLVLKKT